MSTQLTPLPAPRAGSGRRASDRALEDVLRDSEDQVRGLLECAPDAMVVADSDGTIVLVNARVKALFGYEPKELIGANIEMLVPKRSRPTHRGHREAFGMELDGRAMRVGRELNACRRDGSEFPVEISLSAMRTPAGATVSASIRDITERRRTQEAAATASRMKSGFVTNMSHEIRTPLNGLLGMTELLLETPLNESQRAFAEVIRSSGDALMHIVDDVLDFSKIEAGKLALDRSDFDPRCALREALAMVSTAATRKGVKLTTSVDPSVPPRLHSDGNRIRQVLSNLLSNAVKFTAAGEVHVVLATVPDRPTVLRIEVTDTGIGLGPEDVSHVFDSFFQADAATTREFGGCGLGLTICRELVELLGGEIHATSSPGQGSTFSFTVPCEMALGTSGADRAALALPRTRRRARVLVAEDDRVNQIVAVGQLERLGCVVDVAHDGRQAVEMCRRPLYDAILMDCQMPKLDGYDAVREIRRLAGAAGRVPIIAMTAHAMEGSREKCLAAGMNDFLGKPLRGAELAEVLARNNVGRPSPPLDAPPLCDAGAGAEVLDPELVAELLAADAKLGHEVLAMFVAQARKEIRQLGDAVQAADLTAMREVSHRLHGAAATVGARSLSRLCAELTEAAQTQDLERLATLQGELAPALKLVRVAVENTIGAGGR
jgi:PAS domain S-box-containing protein